MTVLDSPAGTRTDTYEHGDVVVVRRPSLRDGRIAAHRDRGRLRIDHRLRPSDLSERLVDRLTRDPAHLDHEEFETAIVGLVRTTLGDPLAAWTTYYRNSMHDLESGVADFAPIHEHAAGLVDGSVLDLGSCFGFLPLRLAARGHAVTATDISPGTMTLLGRVATRLGIPVATIACDAAHVPVPAASADTVTAIHLLEHVDESTGDAIVGEALRIARRRVVVAVPFEDVATACHGHVRTFDVAALRRLGHATGRPFTVHEHHGGWLVLHCAHPAVGTTPGVTECS